MSLEPSILYVEDDRAIAEMYSLGLRRSGFKITVAPDWPAARKLLRSEHFDLVLLDIMLPGTDGMTALAEIRAAMGMTELPVAVLSNSEMSSEVHQRARDLGVLSWMVKSKAPPTHVARAIRRWLKQNRLTPSHRQA
ncbi:MAG TPA: response regulator [Candidatus Dormibacteraeota bacterium]|nr:response regulator [Candidatus Dormibacteraeota bacterium]